MLYRCYIDVIDEDTDDNRGSPHIHMAVSWVMVPIFTSKSLDHVGID